MRRSKPFFRILIVEDDLERASLLQSWLREDVRTVMVTTSGKAIGLLKRDRGNVYAGIMLDHDLQQQATTESDYYLSGGDVVEAVIRNVSNDVPVLVHSMNFSQAPLMTTRLHKAGFSVIQIPMDKLTREILSEWLEEAREIWEDLQEN